MQTETLHDGTILCSDIVNGQLVKYKYQGRTKAQATKLFNKYKKSFKRK